MFCASETSRSVNEADFRKGIKSGGVLGLNGRELEAEMTRLAAKTGSFRPILALNVVNNSAFRPRQQRRNHKPYPFAAARWCERKDVFRAIVPQVVEVLGGLFVPASNIHALGCLRQVGFRDIRFGGPLRRTVKVLSVFGEGLSASEIQKEKKRPGGKRTGDNDACAKEQRKSDSNVPGVSLSPHPYKPFVGRIQIEVADTDQRRAERGLIIEPPCEKLGGKDIR